jgi:MoxR-like ATPase
MRRKSVNKSKAGFSVGSGVLLTGVAGVGKWSATQRIADAIGAEIIEVLTPYPMRSEYDVPGG